MPLHFRFTLTVVIASALSAWAQETPNPSIEIQQANKLAAEKQYDQALQVLDEVLKQGVNTNTTLFAAGSIALQCGRFEKSRDYFIRLENLEPKSGRVRATLVRVYQSLKNVGERDRERKEVLRLWASGEDPELKKQEYFTRDEFMVDETRVSAVEFFELKGDMATRYAFLVFLPEKDQPEYRLALVVNAATNATWRAARKPAPKEDEHLFQLDGYFADGSRVTFGMHDPEPSYDAVRDLVTGIVRRRSAR